MCIEAFVIISGGSLYFCRISGDIPLSFLLHLFESSLSSFLISLASGLFILLIFSENQLFDLLIFEGFFVSLSPQFCSDLSYFLSSASF